LGNATNLSFKPANPGPLGLNCFALTTFLLSLVNAGIIDGEAAGHVWLTLALVLGGAVQVLAGMWEFKTQNVFAATAFSSYGGFWIGLGLIPIFVNRGIIVNTEVNTTLLGWYLVAFTIFTFYMWIASFKTSRALAVVFTALLITFILLDIGHLVNPTFNIAGGYIGIITALCAWYVSAAGVLNEVYGKVILPV
jgi:succinate-acetate transporter protein